MLLMGNQQPIMRDKLMKKLTQEEFIGSTTISQESTQKPVEKENTIF